MQFENSIRLDKLADLPEISAIYAVISQSQGILYIGQSKHLRSRWQRHHRLEQVQAIDPTASLSWFPCDLELLNQTEYSLIQKHQPLLNGSPMLGAKRTSPAKVLQNTLAKLAPYIAVFGVDRQESPATIVIKYFGVPAAGIASRLRTILKGKWVEFVKRKDASWWRFKGNGLSLELGPWLYEDTPTRTAMNSDMSKVLNEKYFPGQNSIDYEKWKSIHQQKRTLEENLEIIRTTNEGLKLFPLQAHAVLGQLATVKVLTLTQDQLSQISLDLESLAAQDPVNFLSSITA